MFQTFSFALGSEDVRQSIKQGKIASLLDVNGVGLFPFSLLESLISFTVNIN